MTATVGSLLDDVHARAWELCSLAPRGEGEVSGEDRASALLAAWPRLAASALRALDSVRLEAEWLDDTASVRGVLAQVAKAGAPLLLSDASGGRPTVNADLMGISVRLGLIADLLAGQPAAVTEVDEASVLGLQANILAPVHALAVATMVALEDQAGFQRARWLLRGVVARTERFALVPTVERAGRYEDRAAITPGEPSLDGVIAGWARATIDVLTSPQRVTGTSLQVAAGDALILSATATTVCAAATQRGVVGQQAGGPAASALAAAYEAWLPLTHWPDVVRFDGGRVVEQTQASRLLRQTITESLRQDGAWLSAESMASRFDVSTLLAAMRRGMHATGNVALAHFQAVENLVRGRGQLWIAAEAVTQPAYWGAATIEAAVRKGWVPIPRGEPAGVGLLAAAREALTASTIALAALDATAAAPSGAAHATQGALRWEGGRIVAYGPGDHPVLFETVRHVESAGARAERRAPIPLGRPTGLGPRR